MPDERIILSFNSGSSSRKFALYRVDRAGETLLAQAAIENIGGSNPRMWIDSGGKRTEEAAAGLDSAALALSAVLAAIDRRKLPAADAVGHRLVHGGPEHLAPERITPALIAELRGLVPFAPLHLPDEIAGIEAVMTRFPALPQAACFDTAFHRRMPEVAQRFPLPRELWDLGIRRYGFHGISYEYIMRTLGAAAPSRVIIAHLGNGASMAAVRDGNPLDTTMGFTPAGGFMMGTRSGDLDPGVIVYLMREKHLTSGAIETMVNTQAGLAGVSNLGSDMKTLLAARGDNRDAALAVAMFCYQARKSIGVLAAALGGLDLLVFTGGIGEHAPQIRWEICAGLEYLGIAIDDGKNQANADTISAASATVKVRVIPTNEDLMVARHTFSVLFAP